MGYVTRDLRAALIVHIQRVCLVSTRNASSQQIFRHNRFAPSYAAEPFCATRGHPPARRRFRAPARRRLRAPARRRFRAPAQRRFRAPARRHSNAS
jgi:hypothetical protein